MHRFTKQQNNIGPAGQLHVVLQVELLVDRNTLTTTKQQETHKYSFDLYKQSLRKREEKRNTNIYNNIQGQHYIYISIL